jgi:hypothetical protein
MDARDLVVAIRADQKDVPHIPMSQQILEQIQRRGIEPLQVVQEQRQRVFRPGEHAEKTSEHELETALCVLRRQFGDRWQLAKNCPEVGDEIRHELCIRSERLPERMSPPIELVFALGKKRADQMLEGLCERGVWNVALVLIKLARRKQAARRDQYPVELVHDR